MSALQTAYQRSQNVLVGTKGIMDRVRSVKDILMICLRYLLHNNTSIWSMHCNNISDLGWVIMGRPLCTLWLMQCTCCPLCYCPLCYTPTPHTHHPPHPHPPLLPITVPSVKVIVPSVTITVPSVTFIVPSVTRYFFWIYIYYVCQ